MKRIQSAQPLLLAALITAALLGGCVVRGTVAVPAPVVYIGGTVNVAPPPPQVEVIGAPPQAGYVWIGGYWNWVGGRHEWVSGHWAVGRPGHHWVVHQWVRQGDGWRLKTGHWERG